MLAQRPSAATWAMLVAVLALSAAARAELRAWCIDDMAKIDPTSGKAWEANTERLKDALKGEYRKANTVWDAATGRVRLVAARNEVVAFQIVLEADRPVKGVTLRATDLAGAGGAKIPGQNVSMFREWYIRVVKSGFRATLGDGWYPDALIPLRLGAARLGAPLDIPDARNRIEGQKNQAVWVDVYVPSEAKPGKYRGAIEIGGPAKIVLPVELEVLNVAIPNTYHHSMDLNSYGDRVTPMRLKYFQLLHRHRIYWSIDSGRIKPDIDPASGRIDWTKYDQANAPLLDGSAFTDKHGYGPGPMAGAPLVLFELPFAANVPRASKRKYRKEAWPAPYKKGDPAYEKLFKDTLKAFDAHFREKGWTKTTYVVFFNGIDEPTRLSEYEHMKYLGMLVHEVNSPLFRHKVDIGSFATCHRSVPQFKSLRGMLEFMDPSVSFWCGNGGTYDNGVALYDVDGVAGEVAKGRMAYYYGTNYPPDQGGSFVDAESIGPRVWPLIAARYDLSGGEIWHFMYNYKDAWEGKPTDAKRSFYGYAQFVYPEQGLGIDFGEPIGSVRLKGFRRGQQDAEYFWLARQGPHKAQAERLLRKLVPAALDKARTLPRSSYGAWPHDPAEFDRARIRLGRLLAGEDL